MSERRRKPGQQVAVLQERTVHGLQTKARIRAVIDLAIDELEQRRAKGKSDHVALLADEIEKGGIAAWKSLIDLLPPDDMAPPAALGNMASATFAGIFAGAAAQAAAAHAASQREAKPELDTNGLPILDAIATPVPEADAEPETPADDEPVEW
jgi:hypothetical protein